jgi:hypothetical protein
VINLRKNYMIISVIYIIVYFAVPGQVEDLSLKPGSNNITVNWKKPILNSYCVTHYVIYWVHTLSGRNDSSIVSSEEDSFVIADLEACAEFEVSVRAVNEKNDSSDAVTGNTPTETDGNYQTHYFVLFVMWVRINEKVMVISYLSGWNFNLSKYS